MIRVTLDTNVVRDLASIRGLIDADRYRHRPDRRGELVLLFGSLLTARNEGRCELGISNRLRDDFADPTGQIPVAIRELIGPCVEMIVPDVTKFPFIFPAVFVDSRVIDEIRETVFPGADPGQRLYRGKHKDAVLLYAHKVAARDVFLTADGAILRASQVLRSKFGICVSTLDDFVRIDLYATQPN